MMVMVLLLGRARHTCDGECGTSIGDISPGERVVRMMQMQVWYVMLCADGTGGGSGMRTAPMTSKTQGAQWYRVGTSQTS